MRFQAMMAVTGLIVVAGTSAAQEPKTKNTKVSADFGFVSAAGNTSVTTFNLGDKFETKTADKRVIVTQMFGMVRSRADGVTNAENFRAQLRLDYGVGGRAYLFGLTGWDRNVLGGLTRRFEETVGLALKVVTRPRDELGIEVGLSKFQQDNLDGPDDNYTAGRAAGSYKHMFGKASFLTQVLELIPNFDNSTDFRLNSETALVAPISANVGLKLGYVVRFDNEPGLKAPPNPTGERFKKTDRFLTAGVSISY
jgi:putative salt-induced outer membrane protein